MTLVAYFGKGLKFLAFEKCWEIPLFKYNCFSEHLRALSPQNALYQVSYYTSPHGSGGALWFHVGRPYICLSVQCQVHWEVSVCIGVWFILSLWG